jgi:hypothetical protein
MVESKIIKSTIIFYIMLCKTFRYFIFYFTVVFYYNQDANNPIMMSIGDFKDVKCVWSSGSGASNRGVYFLNRDGRMWATGGQATEASLGTDGAIKKAHELVDKYPEKYFMPDQFSNEYNKIAQVNSHRNNNSQTLHFGDIERAPSSKTDDEINRLFFAFSTLFSTTSILGSGSTPSKITKGRPTELEGFSMP